MKFTEGYAFICNDYYLFQGLCCIFLLLKVRGHAMFSGVDRPLDSETLEYAWLVEVLVGDITGRLTVPQVSNFCFIYV